MAAKQFEIKDSGEVAKWLGTGMEKVAQRAILSVGYQVQQYIQAVLIPGANPVPVDRGAYRAAWRVKAAPGAGGLPAVVVYNTSPHALFIEHGVRAANVKPGKAMIDALTAWVRRKGLSPAGRGQSGAQAARSMAFAIAKSMQRKGIFRGGHGFQFLKRATEPQLIKGLCQDALRHEVARFNSGAT